MPTLHRKLLGLLPRIGVRVLDLGSGAAVVYRRGERTRVPVGPRADLVLRGTAGASWKDVALGDSGARLLLDEKAAAADERRFQVAAAAYLCGQHVAALLERCEVNCVFDVGANSGQYGRQLRRLGYRGRIVSFEPTAEAFGKLQKAAEGDPEWWVHRIGLGREDATQSINVGWNTMNSLLQPSDYGKDRYKRFAKSRTEDIEIRRLDGMMDKALAGITDPRPYLKMDTQGTTWRSSRVPGSVSPHSSGCSPRSPRCGCTRAVRGWPSRSPCTRAADSRSPACTRCRGNRPPGGWSSSTA